MGLGVRPNSGTRRGCGAEAVRRDSSSPTRPWPPPVPGSGPPRTAPPLPTHDGETFLGRTWAQWPTRWDGWPEFPWAAAGQLSQGVYGTAMCKHCGSKWPARADDEREAEENGFRYVSSSYRTKTRAGYFPGRRTWPVKLVGEEGNGQAAGRADRGRPGHGEARCGPHRHGLAGGMTVNDLLELDLGYAPPFSMAWDPVQIAGRELLKKTGGE